MKYRGNIKYQDYCYWNNSQETYGKAVKVKRSNIIKLIAASYLVLAVLIPVIVPVPVVILIKKMANKIISQDLVYRY